MQCSPEVLEGRAPFQLSLRAIGQAQSLQLGVVNKFYDEELGTESPASATMLEWIILSVKGTGEPKQGEICADVLWGYSSEISSELNTP